MYIYITITKAGADTGPFNLYSDVDGYISAFETNVSKIDLEAGYATDLAPDNTTIVKIQNMNNICYNYVDAIFPPDCNLTAFNISSIEEGTCPTIFAETVDTVAYHNGVGAEPDYGDAVYSDCGITPYPDNSFSSKTYVSDTQDIQITNGVRAIVTCK